MTNDPPHQQHLWQTVLTLGFQYYTQDLASPGLTNSASIDPLSEMEMLQIQR